MLFKEDTILDINEEQDTLLYQRGRNLGARRSISNICNLKSLYAPLSSRHRSKKYWIYGTLMIMTSVYIFWLNSQEMGVFHRHVNTGLTHFVCLLAFAVFKLLIDLCSTRGTKRVVFNLSMNILFIFFLAHFNGFWCYTHPKHKEWCCKGMKEISTFLEKTGTAWKLTGGSLLGAVRDYPHNQFGIFWEKDEDIRIQDINQLSAVREIRATDRPWFQKAAEARVDVSVGNVGNTTLVDYCGTQMPIDEDFEKVLLDKFGGDWRTERLVPARMGISRAIGCSIVRDTWIHNKHDDMVSISFFIAFSCVFALDLIRHGIGSNTQEKSE